LESVYDQTEDGVKHNPWGDGVKGQAIYTSDGHFSWMIMSANRPKADTFPGIPVGKAIAYWGTYTVNEEAKTEDLHDRVGMIHYAKTLVVETSRFHSKSPKKANKRRKLALPP